MSEEPLLTQWIIALSRSAISILMRGLAKSRDCFAPLVMTILAACDRTVTSLQRLQLTDTRFLTYTPQHGDKVFRFYGINFCARRQLSNQCAFGETQESCFRIQNTNPSPPPQRQDRRNSDSIRLNSEGSDWSIRHRIWIGQIGSVIQGCGSSR
jgi:hypothetical protein